MHELSLAENIVELIEVAARREGFVRVTTVFMEIGRLSCVAPEALRVALDHAVRETCLDGAGWRYIPSKAKASARPAA